jgi:NAD(P)H-dependent FMN reductase
MTKIVGIAGSLRQGSYNAALLRAAASLAPDGVEITIGTIRGIPLYDADVEAREGIPDAVATLKDLIAGGDGLLIATPEYNNSMPGVLKNAIDWLSRPPADIGKIFGSRPVAIMGASPGGFGTILSQDSWLSVLRTLGTNPWFGAKMLVSRAGDVFDDAGAIKDAAAEERLRKFVEGFAAFVQES